MCMNKIWDWNQESAPTLHGATLDTFGATPSCVQTLTRLRSVGAPLPHMGLIYYINRENCKHWMTAAIFLMCFHKTPK